jgi:hypothetical protein
MSVRWASAKAICSAEGFSAYPISHIFLKFACFFGSIAAKRILPLHSDENLQTLLRLSSAIVEKNNNAKYQMFNQEQIREGARFDIASGNR